MIAGNGIDPAARTWGDKWPYERAVMTWFVQALVLPDYAAIRYPGLAVSFLAEVGLALWLLVKGVKVADSGATASTWTAAAAHG